MKECWNSQHGEIIVIKFPELFVAGLDSTVPGGGHRPYARFPDIFANF